MTLTGPNGRVIYASGNIPSDKRTIDARFEISNSNGSIQALLSLDASEDDRVLKRLAQTLIAAALGMVFKTPVKPEWRERCAAGTMAS